MKDKKIFKFSFSSILSFLIDFSLFTIFSLFIHNISVCNVLARIISASFNYTMNRKYVFKSNNSVSKSFISYVILAVIILFLNTVLLNLLVYKVLINKFVAKAVTEIILFILSYNIQEKFVFQKK